MEETMKAGFDYTNNSNKWWDFTAPWLIDQYNDYSLFAPSVGFPESHDTTRLSADTNGRIDVQEFRYLFAAYFSAGILIPFGYEYGFKKKMDVVNMTPDDMEHSIFDISNFIAQVNKFKIANECLNEDGPIKVFSYTDPNILIMKKANSSKKQQIMLIYNKNWQESKELFIENIDVYLDYQKPIYRYSIDRSANIYTEKSFHI
jgi:starch synthase (maltosyl-transferring)